MAPMNGPALPVRFRLPIFDSCDVSSYSVKARASLRHLLEVGRRMTFPLPCRTCGHVNQTKLTQVGQSVACGGCGDALKVPPPREKAGDSSQANGMVKFA